MTRERMDTCGGCRHFKRYVAPPGNTFGECRHHSPVVIDASYRHPEAGFQYESRTAWPEVNSDDWCGDFEAKRGD